MPAKIRLQRHGRKKKPFYHIVIADARAPRDGKFIDKIGTYNPMTSPATIHLDRNKAYEWLMVGAQPTHTARAILKFKGVYYKKHLQRGVVKGSLSQEQADLKWQNFIDEKDAKVAARFEETKQKRLEWLKKLSGTPKAVAAPVAQTKAADGGDGGGDNENKSFAESVEQTTVESFAAGNEGAPEAPAPVAEAPKVEETPEPPKAEEPVEAPKAEEKVEATPTPVAPATPAADDDYKKIEGIGPKIAELLHNAGLATFSDLENAPVDKLKGILAEAGSRYTMHDPTTWPQQAALAAAGKWDELKVLQDELDGGKVVGADESKSGEEE